MNVLAVLLLAVTGSFDYRIQITGFEASLGRGELILTDDSTELLVSGEYFVAGNAANAEQALSPFIVDMHYSGGALEDRTTLDLLAFYQGERVVGDESWEVMGGMNGPGSIEYEELRYLTATETEAVFAFDQSLRGHLLVAPQIHYVSLVIPAQTVSLSGSGVNPTFSPEPSTFVLGLLAYFSAACLVGRFIYVGGRR